MSDHDYRDVLLKASELVAEDGRWVQLAWFSTGKRSITREEAQRLDELGVSISVCALGAVTLAADRLGVSESALRGARTKLAWWLRKTADLVAGVAGWNDEDGRTADEVAEALRQAADA